MTILQRLSLPRRPATAPTGKIHEISLEPSLARRGIPIRQRALIAAQLQRNIQRSSSNQTLSARLSICTRLPLELLGEVFTHLSDDKPTLSQCSLVSRAWFYASRPHLFRKLEVSWISLANIAGWERSYMPGKHEDWDGYSRRCRQQNFGAPLTCALLWFLEETGELIRTSVRELSLVGWQHDACQLSLDDVDALMQQLPLLTKLSFTRTTLRWSEHDMLIGQHGALRTLEVRDSLISGSSAFALLSLFPHVEELFWDAYDDPDECDIEGDLLLSVLEHFTMRRLKRIDAGRSLYPHHSPEALALLVQGMCMRGVPPNLACLELDVLLDEYDADALTTLLAEAGANLRALRIEIGCMYPSRVVLPTSLGLEYCTGLRELELSLPSYWIPGALELVPGLLADLWTDRDTSAGLTLVLRFDSAFNDFESLCVLNEDLTWYLEHGLSAIKIRRSRADLNENERASVIETLRPFHEHGALLL